MKKILAVSVASLALSFSACSKDEDKADPVPTAAPTTKLELPASYSKATSPTCASCHGAKGEGQGSFPALAPLAKGEFSDVSKFIAVVRSGTDEGMPPFKADAISDAELTKIHAYFKQ